MIMTLKIGKLIAKIAPKVFKTIKNLKLLGKDVAIDLFKLALVITVILAVLGVIPWDTVDKAFEYLSS